jgi:hypothetical protein
MALCPENYFEDQFNCHLHNSGIRYTRDRPKCASILHEPVAKRIVGNPEFG